MSYSITIEKILNWYILHYEREVQWLDGIEYEPAQMVIEELSDHDNYDHIAFKKLVDILRDFFDIYYSKHNKVNFVSDIESNEKEQLADENTRKKD